VRCRYDPDTKSGTAGAETVKVKGNIHWLSAKHSHAAEVRLYDRLFKVPHPGAGDRDFVPDLNPDSKKLIAAQVEPALKEAKAEQQFQFERHGYFVDRPEGVALVGEAFANLDRATQAAWSRRSPPRSIAPIIRSSRSSSRRSRRPSPAMATTARSSAQARQGSRAGRARTVVPRAVRSADRAGRTTGERHRRRSVLGEAVQPVREGTYVLPKLSNAQAERVARAMVITKLRHPNIHARNSAGHQLYRFCTAVRDVPRRAR
jgi:hypothetical protein